MEAISKFIYITCSCWPPHYYTLKFRGTNSTSMTVMGTDKVVAALVLICDPEILCTNVAWQIMQILLRQYFCRM
jgi:hypothetical protein